MTTNAEDEPGRFRELAEELGQEAGNQAIETGVDKAADGACSSCDGCNGCDGCDLPCDLLLFLRLSTMLLAIAVLVPRRSGGRLIVAAIRFYRRRLTRFTPRCPGTPSCSAFALQAIAAVGPRYGLVAAAARIRNCGRG